MKVFIIFALILILPLAFALSDESAHVQAEIALAEKTMEDLTKQNISVNKYNDTLLLTKQLYEVQIFLENSNRSFNYASINEKLNELKIIKEDAIKTHDELLALEITINQAQDLDIKPVMEIYRQAKEEFNSERYDTCLELIDKTYEKISEVTSAQAKVVAFYDATSRGVFGFLKDMYKEIAIIIFAFVLIHILFKDKITAKLIQRNMNNLESRKGSIEKLIAKTQRDYFEKGELAEIDYKIRVEKYAEIVRDINRQIPLLNEKLEILTDKRGFKSKKQRIKEVKNEKR